MDQHESFSATEYDWFFVDDDDKEAKKKTWYRN